MSDTKVFNSSDYKAALRLSWNEAAKGWDKWWDMINKGAAPVSARLLELADVRPGQTVLDIATGIGEPAISAARVVGPEGRVIAIDLSPGMLDVAKRRAAEAGLDNIEFHEMDAESLPLFDNEFDAVLCRWGLMFLPDPSKALVAVRKVLRRGCRFATAVWDVSEKVPMISLAMKVVIKELKLDPPPKDQPTPFSLADTGALKKRFVDACFVDVEAEPVPVITELSSAAAFVRYIKDVAQPVNAALKDQTVERQAHVWRKVLEEAGKYASNDGTIRMVNTAICVVGTK
jgi:enediyne biosynthesis protein CalE5